MSGNPIRLLLIEDNSQDVFSIQHLLQSIEADNFHVLLAHTLSDGIRVATANKPDIVLLDLSLPDSRGIDTLFRFRSMVQDVAIIVLSRQDNSPAMVSQALQGGAQDYLHKDRLDIRLLQHVIRYAIERYEIEMRLRHREREYRSLIDDVFDTSNVAVIILDREFSVVWCNEATELYFGIERESLLGKNKYRLIEEQIKYIFAEPESFSSQVLSAYDANTYTDSFECHILPGDGREERWLKHWSQPIRDGIYQDGRIEQYTDITARKLLEFAEQQQRSFAEALHDIAMTLTSTLELDKVLGRILNNLHRIVPHDDAAVIIHDDQQHEVYRSKRKQHPEAEIARDTTTPSVYEMCMDRMLESHQSLLIRDLTENGDDVTVSQNGDNVLSIHTCMGAPVLFQNKITGFIILLGEKPATFQKTGLERLSTFAGLAAIAIQNARLFSKAGQLATMEERQRLARELHDSVSQTMFTCRTMLETAVRRFKTDPDQAYELIEQVHRLAITALSEMRILLLELRPETLDQVSLKQLFEQYLQPVQERHQFDLTFIVEDIQELAPSVQLALYRITQEAINNINKHARADHVYVHVYQENQIVGVNISDDGAGFDLTRVKSTSLGLRIMQERAVEIGATLQIESSPDKGTSIQVCWSPSTEE